MGWEEAEQRLTEFQQLVSNLNLRVDQNAQVKKQVDVMSKFFDGRRKPDGLKAFLGQSSEEMKVFYDAACATKRLTYSAMALAGQTKLRSKLKTIFEGSLAQDLNPSEAKDALFELEIAMTMQNAGFTVELREPDIVVSGNGLTHPMGLACKYLTGEASLQEHITKGYRQIERQNLAGCVVLGFDNLVCRKVFGTPPNFIDFSRGSTNPGKVCDRAMHDVMNYLIEKRSRFQSEPPLDGAIATYHLCGIWNGALTTVESWAVQVDSGNPARVDIELLATTARKAATPRGSSS